MKTSYNMKIVSGVIVVMTWTAIPGVAMAKTVMTPFGPADDSCVHEIPNGAGVDVQTGDVSLNDATVSHIAPCTVSPTKTGSAAPQAVPPIQWYEYSNATAAVFGGVAQFDGLEVSWSVPSTPPPSNGSVTYYFPSVQNQNPDNENWSGEMLLLQPVLQYGISPAGGGDYWELGSWGVWGCTQEGAMCQSGFSPLLRVNAGDSITGLIEQTAGNLDACYVQAYSHLLNEYAWFSFNNIPNSWPKFTYAQMGVLEAYGICCSNLSSADSVAFTLNGLWQAGPNWNSFNNVTGTVSFTGYQNPNDYAPHCTFAPMVTTTRTNLTWDVNADRTCN